MIAETSKLSYEKLKASGEVTTRKEIALRAVQLWPGASSYELCRLWHGAIPNKERLDTIRAGLSELLREHPPRVHKGRQVYCEMKDRMVVTWWPGTPGPMKQSELF